MFILLEGPDASGKSTLAKQLSRSTGFEVKHFSYPKSEEEKEHMYDMYANFIKENRNVIVDRCWYSEMVYGNTIRDKSHISVDQMLMLENLVLHNGGGFIIHCSAPIGVLWDRFSKRGDDYVDNKFELLRELRVGYNFILDRNKHLLPVFNYEI